MAVIRKRRRANGKLYYQAIVRRRGHPPIYQSFKRKSAATKWAERIEAEILAGRLLPKLEAEKHTVAEAIDRYLKNSVGELSAVEQRNRRGHLAWWRERRGSMTLADFTPSVIVEDRDLLSRKVSGSTTNRYLATLSVVLDHAHREWQWLDENPMRRVRRKKESPGRTRFLAEEERDALLEACKASKVAMLHPLVLFCLTTGARQGEALALRWKEVDLVAGTARLLRTKNSDSRVLTLHGEILTVLGRLAKTPHISGLVFPGRWGKATFPKKAWANAVATAELEDFRFHDLRHTFASYLAMSGATLPELAAALGHRTLAMVKRYSHLTESHSRAVQVRMAEKWLP